MKKFKRIMALVIALVMVLGMMSLSAFAEVPTSGSITINSPIIGAEYYAYKIFDMTTNEDVDAFSYTIKTSSPFYKAVKAYANMPESGTDANADGLTLTATNSDPTTFNISVTDDFDAQEFGKFILARLADTYEGDDKIEGATAKSPAYTTGTAVTVDDAAAIKFNNLDLGYYLITNKYPDTYNKVYNLTIPAYTDNSGTAHAEETIKLTNESTDAEIQAAIDKYVASKTTDEAVEAYINDPNGDGNQADSLKTAKYGAGNENKWTDKDTLDVKNQLENSYRASAEAAMNKIHGDEADYNVKEPVLVFVDSSQPDAVINEKNELDKWDEPINPSGYAEANPDLPEHGEPKGGKNIVIKEATATTPAIYADWTEANIGDKIHYQLNINATNFERTGTGADSVEQIKEYIIADYQNANMTYSTTDGIKVSIVKKDKDGNVTDTIVDKADYSAWASKFFLNDGEYVPTSESDIFGDDGDGNALKGGLVIPWIYEVIAEADDTEDKYDYHLEDLPNIPNHYKTVNYVLDGTGAKVPETDATTGETIKDKDGNIVYKTETHYFASLYPNDVTIVVDYYMTLDSTATIDDPGNKNISQFGVNFVEDSDTSYTPPTPDDDKKPSEKKTTDEAKVYTYALAIHKVDDEGKDLSGAKFKIKGLTATAKADGWYKVTKYVPTAEDFDDPAATELSTDKDGNLVIDGLSTSAELIIMETEAPAGFNKLEGTVTTNATKISETVNNTATTTYYDADGNETGSTTVSNTATKYFDADGNEIQTAPAVTTNPETEVTVQPNLKAVEFKVVNNKGTELPSTGGIGTTIFYVVGAILVIGAGVVLVTKRRMDS